jgi:hypothetical protein
MKVLDRYYRFMEWRGALPGRLLLAFATLLALGAIVALCIHFSLVTAAELLGPPQAPFGGN